MILEYLLNNIQEAIAAQDYAIAEIIAEEQRKLLAYLLNKLQEAVAAHDYANQSTIAELLLPYEERGEVTNSEIVHIILTAEQ